MMMHAKGRVWLIGCFLLVLCCGRLLAQDEDRIQQIIRYGTQLVTLDNELLAPDFSAANGVDGWYTADTERRFLGADEDAYRVEHSTRNTPIRGLYNETYENTVIVVETTQLSEENANGYGVVCRADPGVENSGYYFYLSGEGSARIFTYETFILRDLAEWTPVEMNTGQATNEIIVVCNSTYLAMFINGELAVEANSDLYATGQIGFSATTYISQTPVNIAFENLRVFASSGLAPPFEPIVLDTVENYGIEWQATIAELQEAGVIPAGGQLIFSENQAFMDGTVGADFYPLALTSSYADVVFGGTMNMTLAANGTLFCGFMSRVNLDASNDTAIGNFETSIDEDGNVLVSSISTNVRNNNAELVELGLSFDKPIYVLYILQGDLATVYINGEAVLTDFEIDDVAGFHGIVLRATSSGGRCDGRNMWAYAIAEVGEGLCEAVASAQVNQRSGPGTTFDRAGTLAVNTPMRVIGQATGADDFVWWQLINENWVREDVVSLQGDCRGIPEVDG